MTSGSPAKITVNGLKKSFDDNHVLLGADLDVQQGESLVLIGTSGVGKSLLLKCILGLQQPDAGGVLVDGVETTEYSGDDRMRIQERHRLAGQPQRRGQSADGAGDDVDRRADGDQAAGRGGRDRRRLADRGDQRLVLFGPCRGDLDDLDRLVDQRRQRRQKDRADGGAGVFQSSLQTLDHVGQAAGRTGRVALRRGGAAHDDGQPRLHLLLVGGELGIDLPVEQLLLDGCLADDDAVFFHDLAAAGQRRVQVAHRVDVAHVVEAGQVDRQLRDLLRETLGFARRKT
ncbi:MAG: ATP-binding cassette domain-containing protein [Pseudomonadota bacterium]